MKHLAIFASFCASLLLGSVGHSTEPKGTLGRTEIDNQWTNFKTLKVKIDPKYVAELVSNTKPEDDIYLEIPVKKEKGFWNAFTVGPCRLSAFGNRYDHNVRQTQVPGNVKIYRFQKEDDIGYEVGLRCTEETRGRYEISLGMTENTVALSSDPSVASPGFPALEEMENDTGVFLVIKWKAR